MPQAQHARRQARWLRCADAQAVSTPCCRGHYPPARADHCAAQYMEDPTDGGAGNSATARAGAAVAQAPGITLPTPLMDVGPLASLLAAPPSAAPG
jgi:hypothetical protein